MRVNAISVSAVALLLVVLHDASVHAAEDGSKPSGAATVTFNITGD